MSETKFTKGPIRIVTAETNSGRWLVLEVDDQNFDGGVRELCETETIAVNVARPDRKANWKPKDDADEIRANANLWAAAPELYEALVKIKALLGAGGDFSVCRSDHTPLNLPDAIAVGNVFEFADKSMKKARGECE